MKKITIHLYKWAGKWGPFSIKIPCGECSLTKDIITDVMQNQLPELSIELIEQDWLSHCWRTLTTPILENHLFGKDSYPHCQAEKALFYLKKIHYTYHKVIKNESAKKHPLLSLRFG
jgi:hypothetical protein